MSPAAEDGIGSSADAPEPSLRRPLAWGLLDQVLSSGTNFALAVAAGRWLGPAGLGAVAVGFAAYVLAIVAQRALIGDPLVVGNSRSSAKEETRAALGATLIASIGLGAAFAVLGLALPGELGRGLLLFAPWIPGASVQDLARVILFRDGRGRSAALNDAVWAATMGVGLAVAWSIGTDWAVVGAWGIGALAGGALGLVQTSMRLTRVREVRRWWREAWPLGRGLAVDRIVATAGSQGPIVVLAALLPAGTIGGLRAVQALFAPLSLLGAAVTLPGLPALAGRLRESGAAAVALAFRLSALVMVGAALYLAVVGAAGGWLLDAVFGRPFGGFENLVWPLAAVQVATAGGVGFGLLLKAAGRTGVLVAVHAAGTGLSLTLAFVLGVTNGALGAAWGIAAAAAFQGLALAAGSRRVGRP